MPTRRGCLVFRPNQPQFFRIILADSLLQHKLLLPKLFVRNYGNKLSNSTVVLKVPSGEEWKMRIVKAAGEIWLEEGWQRFVEYYSVVVGTFLVFQFDHSDCSFCVSIFDSSTTEIEYPYQVEASRVSEAAETSTQIPVDTAPSRKRKEKAQVFFSKPPRKMNKVESSKKFGKGIVELHRCKSSCPLKVNPAAKISGPVYGKSAVKGGTIEDPVQPPRTMKVEHVPHKPRKVTNHDKGQEKGGIPDEKPGANRTMTRSQSKHPTFQVKMQKSYVNSKSDLVQKIPISFTRKHMKVKGEILKPSLPDDSPLPIGASRRSNPIFKVVITLGHIQRNSSMHVPITFIGKLDQRRHEAKLLVGNRYWPVKLLIYSHPWKGRFSGGWRAFVRENCLQAGDVCCFELMDPKSVVIKVTILRAGY